jgi:hypothetical protein
MYAERTFDLSRLGYGLDAQVTCKVIATSKPRIQRLALSSHEAAFKCFTAIVAEAAAFLLTADKSTWQVQRDLTRANARFHDAARLVQVAFYVTPSMMNPAFHAWVLKHFTWADAGEWTRDDDSGRFWPQPKQLPDRPQHLRCDGRRWLRFQNAMALGEWSEAARVVRQCPPEYPRGFFVKPSDCEEELIAWVKANVSELSREGFATDLDAQGRKARDFYD